MIMLTKFNSKTNKKGEFVLNAEIIESIEETPDTVITLTNGKKLIVEEPMEEIVRRTVKYRRALYQNELANFYSFAIIKEQCSSMRQGSAPVWSRCGFVVIFREGIYSWRRKRKSR